MDKEISEIDALNSHALSCTGYVDQSEQNIEFLLRCTLGPEYVENISSRSLKKTSDKRKPRVLSVYFSNFE